MEYITVTEGKAKLLVPNPDLFRRPDGVYEPSWAPVFYNPKAVVNRDLSICMLSSAVTYLKLNSLNIADVLAGVGVRGIRYILEVPSINYVILNDKNPEAVKIIVKNIELNALGSSTKVFCSDANLLLYKLKEEGIRLHYIDIDPYGSPTPFLKSALLCVVRGGLLGITATDIAPLSGIKYLAGSRKYDTRLVRTDFYYEVGLRTLLGYIARRAAELDRYVEPLMCVFHDYYYRILIRVGKGVRKAQEMLSSNIGYITYCRNCLSRNYVNDLNSIIITCPRCGSRNDVLGPLWVGSTKSDDFINNLVSIINTQYNYLSSFQVISKLVMIVKEELDIPYYYDITELASKLRVSMPKTKDVINCLLGKGFKASRTHYKSTGVKTDADYEVVKECIRSCSR
jgi:tRNA (guanine26-N2/guanine27-N2)-dimethyltransferase